MIFSFVSITRVSSFFTDPSTLLAAGDPDASLPFPVTDVDPAAPDDEEVVALGIDPGLMVVVNMVSMAPISLRERRAPPAAMGKVKKTVSNTYLSTN